MESNALQITIILSNVIQQMLDLRQQLQRFEDRIGNTLSAFDILIKDLCQAKVRFITNIKKPNKKLCMGEF